MCVVNLKNILITILFLSFILIISGCDKEPIPACGDGTCDAKEQANPSMCPKDCPKPVKPVCGDGKCDSGEEKICSKDCTTPTPVGCGDGTCDTKEQKNPNSCPQDCSTSEEPGECGDGTCGSGESCFSCSADCGSCPVTSGESRFGIGIHVVRSDLNDEILELGDINLRLNLWDVAGWRPVRGVTGPRSVCLSCCDSSRSSCSCSEGTFYFCTPESRNNIVQGEDLADTFYALHHDILFSVGPGDYGQAEPTPQDFVAEEYPANEQMYKEYLRYLVEQYPNVRYWEIGNEATYSAFWDDSVTNYARLVSLSASEIKSNCPDCKVGISLNMAGAPDAWFNAITGICDEIDFLDLHQYKSYTMALLRTYEQSALTRWKSSCPGVEIISTETGIPSAPVTAKGRVWEIGTSEQGQAKDIIKYFTMMYNAGYSKIYNYLIDH